MTEHRLMDQGSKIAGYFKGKSILITGSTGFLGKIFMEKILRVEPQVKKIYLLVRAQDSDSAKQRVQSEVIGKELFKVLKEEHGKGYNKFMEEKISPIAGDVIYENLGIESSEVENLINEIDIIVNSAATTNFYERYDVSLDVNTLGAKHVLEFAKKCVNLKMLLHVSTAYVAGLQEGLIQEKPHKMGATLNGSSNLDIESELRLVEETKRELQLSVTDSLENTEKLKRTAMKELGIKRARKYGWPNTYVFTKALACTRNPYLVGWKESGQLIFILGYAKRNLSCYLADLKEIMDSIPGDIVVNAMIAAIVMHSGKDAETIYHTSSSTRNPVQFVTFLQCMYRYFRENPRIGKNGNTIGFNRVHIFNTVSSFKAYMTLRYKLPLEAFHIVNKILCGKFSHRYNKQSRRYRYIMRLIDLYAPYTFFRGRFDDLNLQRLWLAIEKDPTDAQLFCFDPIIIDWANYFYQTHIPGVLQFLTK
ncbi:fatty acyl-CoA reductase 1-like protein [Carex littledalei]|uniref:Fatty acyl-CoA reductase n=1 Tax=Carex littledalei TaxID=544730 RepID=A0A833RB49_9POAL|nr:fatty acyl-CoA reductase 1-like protein [Carex littledalei]